MSLVEVIDIIRKRKEEQYQDVLDFLEDLSKMIVAVEPEPEPEPIKNPNDVEIDDLFKEKE